jgi:5'-nucleotidase
MEAVLSGIQGIAVSLDAPEYFNEALDYTTASIVARKVAAAVIEHRLPERILLNVNVPYLKENELKGYRITRQGMRIYRDELVKRVDPRGRPYYWIGGEVPTGIIEDGTDFGDLDAGYVSITPLQMDMTAHALIDGLREWNW